MIVKAAINENLLIASAGSKVIRMVPPLVINKNEINQLVKRLRETFKRFC